MKYKQDTYYIKRVIEGNTSEYTFIIEKYKNMVFTIAMRITGNNEDAEEVAQDVFLNAYRGLREFKGSSKFSTWLYRITYNQAISRTRKKQLVTSSLDNPENSIHEIYGEEDTGLSRLDDIPLEYLKKALGKLDEIDRTILTLYYQDDCSVKEISKITGLTSSNVKVKLFRSRKKLLTEFERLFKNEFVDLL
jgi:RNA polymerase sigma-70 factor (ECF subfamily)